MSNSSEIRKPIAAVFIDGNNLYYAAKSAFQIAKHDVDALARKVCAMKGWDVGSVNFYSGIPSKEHDSYSYDRWDKKIAAMQQQGVNVVTRELAYRKTKVVDQEGNEKISIRTEEKGIDVRIALDVARTAYEQKADVFIIFSQDQDLLEACLEVKRISSEQKRAVRICSAFPYSDSSRNHRGIRDVEAISIDESTYMQCLDNRPYHKTKQEVLDFSKRPNPKENLIKSEFTATQAKFAASAQRFVAELSQDKPAINRYKKPRPGKNTSKTAA